MEFSSTEGRVDLVREGFDCVLRTGAVMDAGLIAWPLGNLRMVNCASPAYLQAHGTPQSVAGLGIIQVPVVGVQALINAGQLVTLLPANVARPMPLTLLYANRRNLSKRVRVVMDWLAGVIATYLANGSA